MNDLANPTLRIVIVNWNSGALLRRCLESIAGATQHRWRLERVVVVDNASDEDPSPFVAGLPLPVDLIRSPTNHGFGRASNLGARNSDADFLLFLNPDTELTSQAIELTFRFLIEQPREPLLIGALIRDPSGSDAISASRFPTIRTMFGHMTRLSRVLPSLFPPQHLSPIECARTRRVDQIIGAFLLIPRTLFESLGGFDERFFMYFEDVDLAKRAADLGYQSVVVADAVVYHVGKGSSDQIPARRLAMSIESRIRYFRKHRGFVQAAVLVVITLAVELPARALMSWRAGERPSETGQKVLAVVRGVALGLSTPRRALLSSGQ
jgi:GT2 family glycosyltransferase